MCGIFGYVGTKQNATAAVMEGLKRLDYRGYDSWGVAALKDQKILVDKHVGIVEPKLLKLPESSLAIGHTRWATNGAVTVANAHPHWASDHSFVLAQNGIAENYAELKKDLENKGYVFVSETDTEVIAHLVEEKRKTTRDLTEAVRLAFTELTGRNTIIVLSDDGQIIAARNGSPLVVGTADQGEEIYLSSDTLSFAPHVSEILVLDNGQMVTVFDKTITLRDIQSGKQQKAVFEKNTMTDSVVDKQTFDHFMMKEIYEEPIVIQRVLEQPDGPLMNLAHAIKKAKTVYCIGSGTAGAAAFQMAYYLRIYGNINAIGLIGAEARDYYHLFTKGDLIIAPSQSGETADVLEVLEAAKKMDAAIASFVNMPGSMMTRMSDYAFMAEAGPEICVMSTKIFVSQMAWGYLVAKAVQGDLKGGKEALKSLAGQIEAFLHDDRMLGAIKQLSRALMHKQHVFLLSKGQNLQIIREGMVKITEGAYIHAHAIPAGDLKHYAITLMEPGMPVIFILSNDTVKSDIVNAMNEVKARGATIIGLAPTREPGFEAFIQVPDMGEVSAIANIVPLQLMAYFMSAGLKHNVDKPRNIAKSVTVK